MSNYKLTNKAVEDLSKIWNYTCEKWSEVQADNYYKLLLDNCKFLAQNPEIGKNYNEIATNLQGFKTKSHLIFYYKLSNRSIEVIRILHSKMDLKKRIKDQ